MIARLKVLLPALCVSLCLWSLPAVAWPEPVSRYLSVLSAVEAARTPQSMEPLFEAALEAQDALMRFDAASDRAWIETVSEDDFRALSAALRGLLLSRGYDVYAQPDADFLLTLAQARGREADRAFFAIYRRSWGEDQMPAYLRLTARVAPCVRFGEGIVPELYAGWTAFRQQHPDAYAAHAAQWVRDLEEAVELGTCACGGVDSVEQELSGFMRRFPRSPAVPVIRARLQQLEDTPERRPVRCR